MTTIYDPHVLAGKRILITGGGTGLGRGVAAPPGQATAPRSTSGAAA